ncbi:MAG: hypothetical protein QW453_01360 [Thermoprotei archaeon]
MSLFKLLLLNPSSSCTLLPKARPLMCEVIRRERCVNPYLEDLVLTGKTYEQGGKG